MLYRLTDMARLKIAIHNEINQPIWLDVAIPEDLAACIQFSKITRAEFLVYDMGKKGQIIPPQTELLKARWT